MTRLLPLLLLLAAAAASAQPQPDAVDSLAQAFLAETGAPSVVVAVSRGGERTVRGYGTVDGAPPDASTRYEIGSVTKTITALVLAEAVARGEVTLETPVQDLLPDSVRLAVANRPVTLVDLATHRAGFPRMPEPFTPASILDPYADYTPADLMAFVGLVQPDSAGAARAYSNAGVGLLGWLLARREGVSYTDLVQQRVFGPLGMDATATSGPVAQPTSTSGTAIPAWSWTDALAGAGAVRSTADDLLTYAEAVARPERAPALAEALRLVLTPHAPSDGRGRAGLAWVLQPNDGPVTAAFHNGATFGSSSFVGVLPERDVAVVVLTNASVAPAVDALASRILRALVAP